MSLIIEGSGRHFHAPNECTPSSFGQMALKEKATKMIIINCSLSRRSDLLFFVFKGSKRCNDRFCQKKSCENEGGQIFTISLFGEKLVNLWILPRNACMIVPKNLVKTKGVKSSLFGGKLVNLWISILPWWWNARFCRDKSREIKRRQIYVIWRIN